MAVRSVFVSKSSYPFFEEIHVHMDWFGGFALSQKRKCQIGLHQNFLRAYPDRKPLEISSSSLMSLGAGLSAMVLSKRTSLGLTTVESAFQSSKVFGTGADQTGPFPEYLFLPGRECRKLVKEKAAGRICTRYLFDGMLFYAPSYHLTLFYDYLYLTALLEPENREVREALLEGGYTAFTDLAARSVNCQARSCAIFAGLVQAGLIDEVRDFDSFLRLFRTRRDGRATGTDAWHRVQVLTKKGVVLLSPEVPCSFRKEAVEAWYQDRCAGLSNKKGPDNFLDRLAG